MDHRGHDLIVLATAILLIGIGIVAIGLSWSRSRRGEGSGILVGTLSRRQLAVSLAGVPIGGTLVLLVIVAVAAALR